MLRTDRAIPGGVEWCSTIGLFLFFLIFTHPHYRGPQQFLQITTNIIHGNHPTNWDGKKFSGPPMAGSTDYQHGLSLTSLAKCTHVHRHATAILTPCSLDPSIHILILIGKVKTNSLFCVPCPVNYSYSSDIFSLQKFFCWYSVTV